MIRCDCDEVRACMREARALSNHYEQALEKIVAVNTQESLSLRGGESWQIAVDALADDTWMKVALES